MNNNNINQIDPSLPLDGADYYELVEEVRKLKEIVKTVLLVAHKPSGSLRRFEASMIVEESVGPAQLADDCLLERHFSDLCIPASAFQAESIAGTKLEDNAIIARHFANESIPANAYQDSSIPLAALGALISGQYIASHASLDGSRAIGTDHIKDLAVHDRSINDMAHGKLTGGADGSFLYKSAGTWISVAVSGGLVYNPGTGQFEVVTPIAVANFADTKARTSDGGASVAGTWSERTIGEISDEADMMSFVGNVFQLLAGTYYFYARVPAYGVGKHQARLYRDNGDSTHEIVLWGSSANADGTAQTDSVIQGFLTVTGEMQSFKIEHWCQNFISPNGLGLGSSSDNTEVFDNHVEVFTDGYVLRLTDDSIEP